MKATALKSVVVVCALALTVFAPTVLAGGGHHDCDASAQDCLNAKAAQYAKHGWLGIETEKNDHGGYTVTAVTEGSPAAEAGFEPGDVLVAMNGISFAKENKEKLYAAKKALGVGKQVTYTVKHDGEKRQVTATLGEVPRTVLAQWIGEHMLEHHVRDVVAQVN